MAAEGLSRLVQVVNDPAFTLSTTLISFEKLKTDAVRRTGHALVLGALYRYVEAISSPQHLSACVGILFTLSQDSISQEVQVQSLFLSSPTQQLLWTDPVCHFLSTSKIS
uniref:HEAT repeat-containing protein 5A-like n=1 Tax=Oncorhynchus gorbuscha TaxID=8017 RepID=UPI001EAE9E0A|nr:HEAT repeat-containing protein 5A-like [Oncorhynchus gorbuscha]